MSYSAPCPHKTSPRCSVLTSSAGVCIQDSDTGGWWSRRRRCDQINVSTPAILLSALIRLSSLHLPWGLLLLTANHCSQLCYHYHASKEVRKIMVSKLLWLRALSHSSCLSAIFSDSRISKVWFHFPLIGMSRLSSKLEKNELNEQWMSVERTQHLSSFSCQQQWLDARRTWLARVCVWDGVMGWLDRTLSVNKQRESISPHHSHYQHSRASAAFQDISIRTSI